MKMPKTLFSCAVSMQLILFCVKCMFSDFVFDDFVANVILIIMRIFCPMIGYYMSPLIGKSTICIGENKDVDQLRGNREADQRLCFRYADSAIPLLSKFKISSI